MSLQQLAAQRMAAQGRGPDTQLVHMSPREVAGLQALAMAQGGSLTINPETGLPEAGFLDRMLPMILGAGISVATGGAATPLMMGLGVGGVQALRTGSLSKGIMAGLGAYGGAGLAGGFMGAGADALANAAVAPLASGADAAATQAYATQFQAAREAALQNSPFGALSEGAKGLFNEPGRAGLMHNLGGARGLTQYGLAAMAAPMMAPPKTITQMPAVDGRTINYAFDPRRVQDPQLGYRGAPTGERNYFNPVYTRLAGGGLADGGATDDVAYAPVVVYGPDGKMYASPQEAIAAGVTNYSTTPPVDHYAPGSRLANVSGPQTIDYVYDPKTFRFERVSRPVSPTPTGGPTSGVDTGGGGGGVGGDMDSNSTAGGFGYGMGDGGVGLIGLGQGLSGLGLTGLGNAIGNVGIGQLGAAESAAAADANAAATMGQAVADAFGVASDTAGYSSSGAGGFAGVGGNIGDSSTGGSTVGIDALGPGGIGDFGGGESGVSGGESGVSGGEGIGAGGAQSGGGSDGGFGGAGFGGGEGGGGEGGGGEGGEARGGLMPSRKYHMAGGGISHLGDYSDGGPIENMSISNIYDMQNARGGVSDMGIDNSTGMQRMAGGGITGSGELNLNIPLNFGGGGGGGFDGRFNQGPLDLGQNRTGFGQSAANGYQPVGSGALSSPPGFLAPKPSSTVGLTENPFNLGTQLASRLGSANQNPFAAQPTNEMMAAQREANFFNPAGNLANLQRRVGDRKQSFDEFQDRRIRNSVREPGDRMPTAAELQSGYKDYVQDRNNNLAKIGGLQQILSGQARDKEMMDQIRGMQESMFGQATAQRPSYDQYVASIPPLAHVNRLTREQYENPNLQAVNPASRFADGGMAGGGISHLGDYSDGGRLLRGPGDGVSDSIPAMIGRKQPARLADGEFVVPARIVSELGNGSTEAGARKLYAMMDRIQKARGKTVGKGKVAKNSRADRYLPA